MAVINTADDVLTHPLHAGEYTGKPTMRVVKAISVAAGDDDGSKWLLAELPDTAIVDRITLESAAITGGTDYEVGLYTVDGTVISKGCFATGVDMSNVTGLPTGPFGDPIREAMTALDSSHVNKKLYEIASHVNKAFPAVGETQRKSKYRICLTADTVGTGAGNIIARIDYRCDLP
jgi:hypothetical protein